MASPASSPTPPPPPTLQTDPFPPLHAHVLTVILLPARDTSAADFKRDFLGDWGIVAPYGDFSAWPGSTRGRDPYEGRLRTQKAKKHGRGGDSLAETLPGIRWVVVEAAAETAKVVRGARVLTRWGDDVEKTKEKVKGKGTRKVAVRAEEQRIRQWWDICSTRDPDEDHDRQREGWETSLQGLTAVMEAEIERLRKRGLQARAERGKTSQCGDDVGVEEDEEEAWGANRLVLMGMEQGAALALHAMLGWATVYPHAPIAGLVAINGWTPFAQSLRQLETLRDLYHEAASVAELERSLHRLHAFVAGNGDAEVVHAKWSDEMAELLQALGVEAGGGWYPDGGDWLQAPDGVEDVRAFLEGVIARFE